MKRVLFCSLLLCAGGCGADLGLLPGYETTRGHAVASGRMAFATKLAQPLNERGFLVGAAIETRAEQHVGARWDGGLMLGWGCGPAAIDGRMGVELYGEFGTPLHATLLSHGDLYLGAGAGMPIRIGRQRHVDDLNDATWLARRRFEIVPMVRTRWYRDHSPGARRWRGDFAIGFNFRLRVFTDLL